MSSPELIYKTTSPAAIDWWNAIATEHDRVQKLRRAYEAQALSTFGPVGKRYSYSDDDPTRRLVVSRHIASGLCDTGGGGEPREARRASDSGGG